MEGLGRSACACAACRCSHTARVRRCTVTLDRLQSLPDSKRLTAAPMRVYIAKKCIASTKLA